MADPQTVNVGLIVPLTGADVDTWGSAALNPDFVALDGMLGGVQTISLSSVPVTLTAPAGFTPTPGAGPTQAQNAVLAFTGVLTATVTVTLPLPGYYVIDNRTTGSFVMVLRAAGVGDVIGLPQGMVRHVYCDGTNVKFVNLPDPGAMEFWAGFTSMPGWVALCTKKPWLLCDGTVYNMSDYPYLARFGSSFGGNGITTFATPDMQGRVPLAYDGTGTRITVAGCGINGQTIGAALSTTQTNTLVANQIPSLASSGNNTINVAGNISVFQATATYNTGTAPNPCVNGAAGPIPFTASGNNNITVNYTNNSQQKVNNVQPSIVAGIWVVKT